MQENVAAAIKEKEERRAELASALERRMAAMEAAMAARRTPVREATPEAARGPGAELRFKVYSSKFVWLLKSNSNVEVTCVSSPRFCLLFMYTEKLCCNVKLYM